VVALELADGATALHQLPLTGDVCLVVGHEDRGLSPATLDTCDAVGFVPQLGKIGSLNVATAAAIALYEARRQHWHD
jgi:tRNA (guanosine-2'-O-)-methyltransferase